ncbi:leucine--tRNA ligase [Microscilla marina]|uniref:Leucine--tRNA ligase n=1 Tax=Microscilla marina ATCC 23134 TaxID=313606 RepID=A1ZH31_MICM2|nr:leucine--tRNA ligase [Microscilla marina]EAY30300.1 leucyl-tRNA synthetase [Microscilla marina ATCC 23134]
MVYDPKQIEPKWQEYWQQNNVYKTEIDHNKPKYYTLDMFPYPSGKGLHIGHPLGYTASDIMARYKRMKGFNVLHPMGFDSFGLPAEQHAIDTGQHPAVTTEQNIATFKSQLSKLGFCFDWSREIQTSSPEYYQWTQWIFMQLFNSWFNYDTNKAEAIDTLYAAFEQTGNQSINAACDEDVVEFTAEEWKAFTEEEKYKISLQYRLTYVADSVVNWCPALGTVLANDEIKDGVSERGGHPVERKKMKQWSMRITAYADRLLQGLDKIEWSDPLKEMQRNWIGKSHGAEMDFKVDGHEVTLTCFTTRPDTIYGVTFMVMAPEHDLVAQLTTPEQKAEVEAYVEMAKNRSERERQSEVKRVSGVFTGSYVMNPISGEKAPLWVADYVLAGYGTGVVMAVPGGDERDFRFARHFNLPVTAVVKSTRLDEKGEVVEANPTKDDVMINSGFLNGMTCLEAIQAVIKKAEADDTGKGKVNFRLRDAVFSRQRYWGEPVPAYFKNDLPYMIKEEELPLTLPEISEYKPTADGDPPLGRAKGWLYQGQYPYELTTMPGWAGSSWYFARYMDAQNAEEFVNKEKAAYWNQVDLYIGGTEHAVGHLLYARFWAHFLNDRGFLPYGEPFKKLINQGMIQGNSAIIYRLKEDASKYISAKQKGTYKAEDLVEIHVTVKALTGEDTLDLNVLREWKPEDFKNATFVADADGSFYCDRRVEKMGKRYHNAINPDDVIADYSADTLRCYEMFLGPLEQSKPWDTKGIDGVHKFFRKMWRLFHSFDDQGEFDTTQGTSTDAEQKIIHKAIKRVTEDLERFSFNTPVSTLMICVNELTDAKCNKHEILENLLLIAAPYAPHIAEELWAKMGHVTSIHLADFPTHNEKYLQESSFEYPISINGKKRTTINVPLDMPKGDIEKQVLANEIVQKWLEGKAPKKVIVVPKRIVNVVI